MKLKWSLTFQAGPPEALFSDHDEFFMPSYRNLDPELEPSPSLANLCLTHRLYAVTEPPFLLKGDNGA